MKCGQWKNNGAKIGPCVTQFLLLGYRSLKKQNISWIEHIYLKILMAWNVVN